jgi:hypothetical protein
MMISCGAALFDIRLALRSLGWIPQTRVLPDPAQPTLVAQVSWRERAAADELERGLSSHVLTRRTHRGAFDPEPLPPDTLATLATAVQTAEHQLRHDGERLRELARWTPAPGQRQLRRSAGYLLPGAGRAHPAILPRPGFRPRARLGDAAAQPGHLAPGRRHRRTAHHDRR